MRKIILFFLLSLSPLFLPAAEPFLSEKDASQAEKISGSAVSDHKTIRLGVVNPTPRNLQKILFLINNDYLDFENFEIIGIFHADQKELIAYTKAFINNEKLENVKLTTISYSPGFQEIFKENSCTEEFLQIFRNTDGLLFLGGADIPPALYGEETFLTTELIPPERNWEISFLFHLIGSSRNGDFEPFLERRPNYTILGICLGMQQINVAAGGSLYQDIPFQIYREKSYESIEKTDPEKRHKNYIKRITGVNDPGSLLRFHHIKIIKGSNIDFSEVKLSPTVTSVHHQAVKKLGRDLRVSATSVDGKVIEAIEHTKYKNVYGIQFHPEFTVLFLQDNFSDSQENKVILNDNDKLFNKIFWKNFRNRFY